MTKSLAHQLANYACSIRFEDLSPEVVHEVKRRVIDSIGCALGAWNEEPCIIARNVASEFSAKNGATIIGTSHKSPPDLAAFATGCRIRERRASRRLLSTARARRHDRTCSHFRRADGFRETAWRLVRQNRREVFCAISEDGSWSGVDDPEHEYQILAGGISQPERD